MFAFKSNYPLPQDL
jgi:hypothetical protein